MIDTSGKGTWKDSALASGEFGTSANKMNVATLTPVKAFAVKVEVSLKKQKSAGILELQINGRSPSSAHGLKGNIASGRKLFFEHTTAACIRCHQIEGKGALVGPKLDGIASRMGRDYLYTSLVNPQADIAKGYPSTISAMPDMTTLLKHQEIADVLAFLLSLKAPK